MSNDFNIKEIDLIHPVFRPNYYTGGYMTFYLDSAKGQKCYTSYNEICGDDYCNNYENNSIRFIDVDCLLGGPYALKYYAMKKISLAFPELNINAKDNVANICWYEIDFKDDIYEEIDCPSNDLYVTINRILDIEGVEIYNKNPFANRYYCRNREEYTKFRYESILYKDNEPIILKDIDTKEEALMNLYDKYNDTTLKGYINFVNHIAQLHILPDNEFERNTSLALKINKKEKAYYGIIHFYRDNGFVHLKLLVQYEIRSYIEKGLQI